MIEWPPFKVAFNNIGAKERPQVLHQPADPGDQRIIASKAMFSLQEIIDRDGEKGKREEHSPFQPAPRRKSEYGGKREQGQRYSVAG